MKCVGKKKRGRGAKGRAAQGLLPETRVPAAHPLPPPFPNDKQKQGNPHVRARPRAREGEPEQGCVCVYVLVLSLIPASNKPTELRSGDAAAERRPAQPTHQQRRRAVVTVSPR